MKIIVGLGNPGPKYDGTRHNIGFAVIDYLAAAPGISGFRSRFQSAVTEMAEGGESALLMKPETFMNLSGRAVRAAVDFYKGSLADVLIICDDMALPLGKLRMKTDGSHGGQNGLRNIQEQLGTTEYTRLRIGIGSPGPHEDAADYVLGRFKAGERTTAEDAVAAAAQAILLWMRSGAEMTMNKVNGGPQKEKPKKEKPEAEKPKVEKPKPETQKPD